MFKVLHRPTERPITRSTHWLMFSYLCVWVLMTDVGCVVIAGPLTGWTNFVVFECIFLSAVLPSVWFNAKRSYWAICWLWLGSLAMVMTYLICLVFTAVVFFGWYKILASDYFFTL